MCERQYKDMVIVLRFSIVLQIEKKFVSRLDLIVKFRVTKVLDELLSRLVKIASSESRK